MRYNDQKKMFYIQLFVGMLLLGYNAVKLVRNGYDTSTVDMSLALAVGVLMPLAGYCGLRRVRAQDRRKRAQLADADTGRIQDR